ncbi:MAG: hypothetical protein ACREBB_03980 [Nitrosotalea sp.]
MKITLWQRQGDSWTENDHTKYSEIIEMLNKIKEIWKVDYQIISNFDDGEIYRNEFLKNRNMLKKRTGRGVTTLRSNSGNIYVNGVLGIYDDSEEIIYYTLPWEKEQLLQNLISQGPTYVNDIVENNLNEAAKNLPEDQLIVDFIKNATQYGYTEEIKREYPLVNPIEPDSATDESTRNFIKSFAYTSAKYMDMLHVAKDGSYDIIEAKRRLNWEALGQAIGYRAIFCKLYSKPLGKTRVTILCQESDAFIEVVCESLDIRVITLQQTDVI